MPTAARANPTRTQAPARPRGRAAPPLVARPPSAAPTPEELAGRAQAGCVESFRQLVIAFEGRLYNFLLRRVRPADAEDLAQETFVRAWQRIGQYDPRWRFSTWLFTIATRLASSHSRRTRPAPSLHEDAGAGMAHDPAQGIQRLELRDRVWLLVDEALPPEQRTAVWLRYVEGMSMQEIAQVLRKSPVGIRVMLHRARHTLAARIDANGWHERLDLEAPARPSGPPRRGDTR